LDTVRNDRRETFQANSFSNLDACKQIASRTLKNHDCIFAVECGVDELPFVTRAQLANDQNSVGATIA
jgi:hypothetical protein